MGRTVSVYIDDHLVEAARKTGKPLSRVVREALERYLGVEERKEKARELLATLKEISLEDLGRALQEVEAAREDERW